MTTSGNAVRLIAFPVKDLTAAKKVIGAFLSVEPYVDSEYYVGYRLGDMELGLDPNGHAQGYTAPIAYADIADIKQSIKTLVDAGAKVIQEPTDVGGGLLIARLQDADGNFIGLRQGWKE